MHIDFLVGKHISLTHGSLCRGIPWDSGSGPGHAGSTLGRFFANGLGEEPVLNTHNGNQRDAFH